MFKSKKISSGLSVGKKLKRVRLKKKYTLELIEAKTKIRQKYLAAIESDSFEKLPNQVYVKGFLKTYASFLELNQNDILEQYKRENFTEENNTMQIFDQKYKKPKIVISSKTLIISLITAGVLCFAIFLIFQIMGFISPPALNISSPDKDGLVTNKNIAFIGQTDSLAEVFINDQKVAIDKDGAFKEEVLLKDGTNIIQVKAVNKAGKEVAREFTFHVENNKTKLKTAAVSSKLDLKISVLEVPTWVKIVKDGENVYQGIMVANSHQEIIADEEIIISTGNAGATKIILNGKDQGILGEQDEVKKNIRYSI